ncbi:MAG: homospermidine synthase, partial [Actinobacteria bacterium]|nr:homospermidine synthase [Actinomycetota bacterium]
MIGMGSIGRATLPLLDRHIAFDKSRAIALDPLSERKQYADEYGIAFQQVELTPENYVEILTPLLTNGEGQGFCVNLSVDTGSVDIMRLCRELNVLYIDTVVEPWPGLYYNQAIDNADRTNQFLRSQAVAERRRSPGGTTAVSCCGANPGMVSWFVKDALVRLNDEMGLGLETPAPADRDGWSRYMQSVGVKGIHIAERDTQRVTNPKPVDTFWNTWSVDGFISEGLQPAELGWGTHEKWMPENARRFADPESPAIYLESPGAETR